LLAERAGRPILPLGVGSRPARRLRSWDRFLVPPPFARLRIELGEPIPPGEGETADAAAIRGRGTRVEAALRAIQERAEDAVEPPR
jgi:lysophospholipid acyltransferase (LPLAT)-like uncharacterized protein